jgi:hypothetical protein
MSDSSLFVFDTNTLVSALLFANSKPAQALHKAQTGGFLVCSDATYAELSEVLMRSKFDKYVSWESRQHFLTAYQNAVLWVDIAHAITDCRDAKDNKFLEVAVSSNASCIISGDDDLLILHPYGNIQILAPAGFLAAGAIVEGQ